MLAVSAGAVLTAASTGGWKVKVGVLDGGSSTPVGWLKWHGSIEFMRGKDNFLSFSSQTSCDGSGCSW